MDARWHGAALAMAQHRLAGGEHWEETERAVFRYLFSAGLEARKAGQSATDIVREALALRDGFAGGGEPA